MTLSQLECQLWRMRKLHGDAEVRITGCEEPDEDGTVPDGIGFGIHAAAWDRRDGEPVVVYLDVTSESDSVCVD